MLLGQYEGIVGDKSRMAFPSKFREILGEELIITKGLEGYLIALSVQGWEALLEGTEGKPFTNKSTREMQRFLLGNAAFVTLDSKGRFVLPEHLRVYASLKTEIVFAGIHKFVEIWDKQLWEETQHRLAQNIENIAEKLSRTEE